MFEGLYEISNKFRVKSVDGYFKRGNSIVFKKGKFLNIKKNYQVVLYNDGVRKYINCKKIFLELFGNSKCDYSKYFCTTIICNKPTIIKYRELIGRVKMNQKNKKCRYTGVSLNTSKGLPFQASIQIGKKQIHLGYFKNEIDAAIQYKKAAENAHLYNGVPKLFRDMLNYVFTEFKIN